MERVLKWAKIFDPDEDAAADTEKNTPHRDIGDGAIIQKNDEYEKFSDFFPDMMGQKFLAQDRKMFPSISKINADQNKHQTDSN